MKMTALPKFSENLCALVNWRLNLRFQIPMNMLLKL